MPALVAEALGRAPRTAGLAYRAACRHARRSTASETPCRQHRCTARWARRRLRLRVPLVLQLYANTTVPYPTYRYCNTSQLSYGYR